MAASLAVKEGIEVFPQIDNAARRKLDGFREVAPGARRADRGNGQADVFRRHSLGHSAGPAILGGRHDAMIGDGGRVPEIETQQRNANVRNHTEQREKSVARTHNLAGGVWNANETITIFYARAYRLAGALPTRPARGQKAIQAATPLK